MLKLRRKELRRRNNERYRFIDLVMDILFWIPELLLLPFRLLFYLGRTVLRWILEL